MRMLAKLHKNEALKMTVLINAQWQASGCGHRYPIGAERIRLDHDSTYWALLVQIWRSFNATGMASFAKFLSMLRFASERTNHKPLISVHSGFSGAHIGHHVWRFQQAETSRRTSATYVLLLRELLQSDLVHRKT